MPLIALRTPFKIAAKPLQMDTWLLLAAYRKKIATALSAGTIADPLRLTVDSQYRMIGLP